MNITLAGLMGLLIGSFLNAVVWRVPRHESLLHASHCPHCDAKIRPLHNVPVVSWIMLRGRCADCRARISVRYPLIEVVSAAAFAFVTWWFLSYWPVPVGDAPAFLAWGAALGAYLWMCASGIALAVIDLEVQRLPNAIVLPSLGVVAALLSVSAALTADWGRLIAVLGGAAVLFLFYFVIVLVYPRGIGGGDVKLAPVLGAAMGYVGWGAVIVGTFTGFLIGAVVGLGAIAVRRAGRTHAIPFGPWMIAGAWVGIVCGEPMMYTYLRLTGIA